jgi:hypothetical protein
MYQYTLNKAIFLMVSHMVFLTKLDFENLKNLVTSSPQEKKNFGA